MLKQSRWRLLFAWLTKWNELDPASDRIRKNSNVLLTMKRPGFIMNVYVIAHVTEDGSIHFNEFKDRGKPLWFFAVPRKDDVFYLFYKYYRVLFVQYEVSEEIYQRPNFFAEGTIYVKEIGGKLEFRKALKDSIDEIK